MTLALADVSCVRGGRELFRDLSLSLTAGEAALVTGPNGAGKSSLLRIAAGLLRPWAGTVTRPARLALVSEAAALDGERTVALALGFWARLDRVAEPAQRVAAALDDLDLAALADVPVRLLSTGQRRRAALARAVAAEAPLWLLDEPANGLDAASVARLEGLIDRHRGAGGIAVVASHQSLALPGAATVAL